MYIRFKTIIFITVLSLLASCREEENVVVTSKNELYHFLDTLEQRYEKAYSSVQLSLMRQAGLTDSAVSDSGWSEAARIFLDTSIYNTIVEWNNRSSSLADKELERRLSLWYRVCLGGKIFFDPEICSLRQKLFKSYEQNLKKGQSLSVSLKREKSQARRKEIYNRFSSQHANLIPDYITLVKLHNEKVRELSFPNYYSFLLYLEAVNEMWLVQTIRNLEEHSRPAYHALLATVKKKYRNANPALWEIESMYGERPELPYKHFPADSFLSNLRKFTSGIGAPIDSLQIRLIEKGKSTVSKSFVISVPGDVRLEFGSRSGMDAYRKCLHSFGSAFYAATIEVPYPILKGYGFIPGATSASYHDGVTMVFQEFLEDSSQLAGICGIREKDLQDYLGRRPLADLYRVRSLIREFIMEYELYKNPAQDLDTLATTTFKQFLSDTSAGHIEMRFAPTLEQISFSGIYHKEILRDLISAQLYEALMNKFGSDSSYSPEIAAWMINTLYRSGELLEWDDRIKLATGKSVEPGAYLRKLHIEHSYLLEQ